MHRLCQQGKPALEDIFRKSLVLPWRTPAYHMITMILCDADCSDNLWIQLSIHIDARGAFAFNAAVSCQ